MMTDEQRGFWSAIRATPEHDLPRVVYADWLEESGQPERAEVIRRLGLLLGTTPET